MKELKLFFHDEVDSCTIQKCCLNALKNKAAAIVTEKFVIAEDSMPDLEMKQIYYTNDIPKTLVKIQAKSFRTL